MRLFSFLCLLSALLSAPGQAALPDTGTLARLLPAGSDFALLIASPDLKTTYLSHDATQLKAPASTQKLVTALATRLYLPADFRFDTRLERAGEDLILRFSGDPTLTRADLRALVQQLGREQRTISGDILLDSSVFSGYERAVGWPWDILGVCYSAPASALTLERNCVQGALYRNQMPGQIARASVPEHQPVLVASSAEIVSAKEQKQRFCALELSTSDNNHYQLSGCVAAGPDVMPLRFAVQNTELYISEVLRAELKRARIDFNGRIRSGRFEPGRLIAEHHSEALTALIDTMLKDSDNLIADNLTKTLGAHYFKQPGSFDGGLAAIRAILRDQAGIDLEAAVLADGSGLSRNNRMTAQQLAEVLSYIYRNDASLDLLQHLPVAGQSGTLRFRPSLRQKPMLGALQAKSGTLFGAYNLAGIAHPPGGDPLLVIQLVNNYHPPARHKGGKKRPAIWQFEQYLYRTLLGRNAP